MNTNLNQRLQQIMERHKTKEWNEDCMNDPEYIEVIKSSLLEGKRLKYSPPFSIGSYKYKRKGR